MKQAEIDEISNAFKEAWTDYFGDEMYYIPFKPASTTKNSLYNEAKTKVYDTANKKLFHGTLKESPAQDELHQGGYKVIKTYEITFVTKELIDLGINYMNTNDIISYTDRFGTEKKFTIVDDYQKVQLTDNKIFTKLKVKPYGN